MKLKEALEKGIITIIECYQITCQKCGKSWKLKDETNLPKVCNFCKLDPYTGPGKRGRPWSKK